MIRPNWNKLQMKDRVRFDESWEDPVPGTEGEIIEIKKNRAGQTVWADVQPDDGSEPIRLIGPDGLDRI